MLYIIPSRIHYPSNYPVALSQALPHEWKDPEYLLRMGKALSKIQAPFSISGRNGPEVAREVTLNLSG